MLTLQKYRGTTGEENDEDDIMRQSQAEIDYTDSNNLLWLKSESKKCDQMTSVAFKRAVGNDEEYQQM